MGPFPSISSSPIANRASESDSRLSNMLLPLSEFMANPMFSHEGDLGVRAGL